VILGPDIRGGPSIAEKFLPPRAKHRLKLYELVIFWTKLRRRIWWRTRRMRSPIRLDNAFHSNLTFNPHIRNWILPNLNNLPLPFNNPPRSVSLPLLVVLSYPVHHPEYKLNIYQLLDLPSPTGQWRITRGSANNAGLAIRDSGKDEEHCWMRSLIKSSQWRGLALALAVLISILAQ